MWEKHKGLNLITKMQSAMPDLYVHALCDPEEPECVFVLCAHKQLQVTWIC